VELEADLYIPTRESVPDKRDPICHSSESQEEEDDADRIETALAELQSPDISRHATRESREKLNMSSVFRGPRVISVPCDQSQCDRRQSMPVEANSFND
jgi:hypothetical protein